MEDNDLAATAGSGRQLEQSGRTARERKRLVDDDDRVCTYSHRHAVGGVCRIARLSQLATTSVAYLLIVAASQSLAGDTVAWSRSMESGRWPLTRGMSDASSSGGRPAI